MERSNATMAAAKVNRLLGILFGKGTYILQVVNQRPEEEWDGRKIYFFEPVPNEAWEFVIPEHDFGSFFPTDSLDWIVSQTANRLFGVLVDGGMEFLRDEDEINAFIDEIGKP